VILFGFMSNSSANSQSRIACLLDPYQSSDFHRNTGIRNYPIPLGVCC
jgi:hypothetical protein